MPILQESEDNVKLTKNMKLTDKLTRAQQQEILQPLFGFEFINTNDDHYVLMDEEGDQFYGSPENCQFDFSTLGGIFSYTAHRAKNQGYADCQFAVRQVIGAQSNGIRK